MLLKPKKRPHTLNIKFDNHFKIFINKAVNKSEQRLTGKKRTGRNRQITRQITRAKITDTQLNLGVYIKLNLVI